MILIGGDKFPQSMTGVPEASPEDLNSTAAVSVVNFWVPDIVAVAGTVQPFPTVATYPADARGFWVSVVSSDVTVVSVDTAEEQLNLLQPGVVQLVWTVSNADGSIATYTEKVTVTAV
jgi:hypothetical protein